MRNTIENPAPLIENVKREFANAMNRIETSPVALTPDDFNVELKSHVHLPYVVDVATFVCDDNDAFDFVLVVDFDLDDNTIMSMTQYCEGEMCVLMRNAKHVDDRPNMIAARNA